MERHLAGAASLLTGSVAPSTQRKYHASWMHWRTFLDSATALAHDPARPDSSYFLTDTSFEHSERLLMMFTHYLVRDLNLSAETVVGHLSGLGFHFRSAGCDTAPLTSKRALACRRALFKDPAAFRAHTRQALPATFSMVESIVRHFDRPALRKRIIAVAAALAFCCLLRASEYCQTSNAPDADTHILRASHVLFELRQSHVHNGPPTFVPAHELPAHATFADCVSIKIVFATAKNISLRASKSLCFSAKTTPRLNLAALLFNWARDARLSANDPFLSFPGNPRQPRQRLQYARLNSIIRHTAKLFGLRPAGFSSHSFRIGGATHLRALGQDDGTIMRMGRWKSLPACLGYQAASTHANDRVLGLLSSPGNFTTRDVHLSDRHTALTSASPRRLPRRA